MAVTAVILAPRGGASGRFPPRAAQKESTGSSEGTLLSLNTEAALGTDGSPETAESPTMPSGTVAAIASCGPAEDVPDARCGSSSTAPAASAAAARIAATISPACRIGAARNEEAIAYMPFSCQGGPKGPPGKKYGTAGQNRPGQRRYLAPPLALAT